VACTRAYGNEPSDSINCWEILEWLSDWRLLQKGSAPWSLFSNLISHTGGITEINAEGNFSEDSQCPS
jgi:hypothetical protein